MKIDEMYLTLHVVVSNSIILLASVAMPGELKLGVKGLLAFGAGKVTVRFQMCLQLVCLKRSKVALVAFMRLFSRMRFQMFPQIAFMRRGVVALVAFVRLFPTVATWVFRCVLKWPV